MSLINYLLLWIMPLLTVNMFLMRIRGIAEHGLPSQLKLKINLSQEGALLTRSLNTSSSKSNLAAKNIERFLIGSLSINYHLEHHLIPNIPHYNLRKTYNLLKLYENSNLRTNYQAGYFSSLWQFIK
jgi:fatty acid desaturase